MREIAKGETLSMGDTEHPGNQDATDVSYNAAGTLKTADKSVYSLDSRDMDSADSAIFGIQGAADAAAEESAIRQDKYAVDHHAQAVAHGYENGVSVTETNYGMEDTHVGENGNGPTEAKVTDQQFEEAHGCWQC